MPTTPRQLPEKFFLAMLNYRLLSCPSVKPHPDQSRGSALKQLQRTE